MPSITIIKPEFAEAVAAVLGELSPNQAKYKTGISDEYIRKMRAGLVPSEAILERFAKGMGADLHTLLIAAGYEQPRHATQIVELGLRGADDLPDYAKRQIVDFARKVELKYCKQAQEEEQSRQSGKEEEKLKEES